LKYHHYCRKFSFFHHPSVNMPRKTATAPKPATGPPQGLVSWIEHLCTLLQSLPQSLLLNLDSSNHHFHFDKSRLEDGSYFAAAGHALEVSFETHHLATEGHEIQFTKRGKRLEELAKFFKIAVKEMAEGDRAAFCNAWLECLIKAARDSGASIPPKKRKAPVPAEDQLDGEPPAKKANTVFINTDDSDDESGAATTTTSHATSVMSSV
jgi:hypothetical protein